MTLAPDWLIWVLSDAQEASKLSAMLWEMQDGGRSQDAPTQLLCLLLRIIYFIFFFNHAL